MVRLRARVGILFLAGAIVASSGCLSGSTGAAWKAASLRLVAYGDSFTAGQYGEVHDRSWATGTDPSVPSVLQRLRASDPSVAAYNGALNGARMRDLPREVGRGPGGGDLVLILMGLNDVCVDSPRFDPAAFERDTRTGFDAVHGTHPDAAVVVFAVPDPTRFRDLHRGNPDAERYWSRMPYCSDALAPGASPQQVAQARARVLAADDVLLAAAFGHGFLYSNRTEWPGFTGSDVSSFDYFHPSSTGEARLAAAAWDGLLKDVSTARGRGLHLVASATPARRAG